MLDKFAQLARLFGVAPIEQAIEAAGTFLGDNFVPALWIKEA